GHDVSDYAYKARAFGWETIVIDGHNLTEVAKAYQKASLVKDVPVMIIAKTIKGKGLSFLEDQDNWHGKALSQDHLQKALIELGDVNVSLKENILLPKEIGLKKSQSNEIKLDKFLAKPVKKHLATRKAYGNAITKLGAKNQKIVVLDAEMGNSTFANIFAAAFPDRFFEMFIAEQNMISVAVGLSRMGKIPFISTFASFLTRAFDQIRMAQYSKANIKLIGSHAGVSIGQDGPSQMGLEDISMFRSIRDSVVLYPSDAVSTEKLVQQMTNHKGISYLRTTRIDTPIIYKLDEEFKIGGSKVIYQSKKDVATVIAAGITLHEAMKAYRQLRKNKINIRVIDLYSIKPLDIETLMKSAQETKALVTAEDHYQFGGIGEAVKAALVNQNTPVHSLYVDQQPRSGQPAELLALEKIDAAAIVEKVRSLI
ncbi:MAG: transketolase, partial [Candidatus Pacebacteria bacterium]|nr:transketolase [Candidatus Paceibacterota bacterium]MBT7183866.1 transketolase [Candidatus Paceibacterota bacterium]